MLNFMIENLGRKIWLCGFVIILLCSSLAARADVILKYSDHQPQDGMRTKFLNEVFFPAIERESEGRIKIEKHWDGEVAISYKALATLKEGKAADISTIVPEYTAVELPLHQIFKSFPAGPSGAEQVSLFRDIYEAVPEFQQELENNNIVPIFLSTGYPAGFFGTSALQYPADIKNQKWRSASFWHLDFLKNAGAVPVRMHWGPEIYTALQDGELDGLLVNIDSAYNLKLHHSAKNALIAKNLWLGHLYIVAMNKDRYASLSAEDKEALKRAAVYSYRQLGKIMDESFREMITKLQADGSVIRILTVNEVNEWAVMTGYKDIQAEWAAEQSAQGVEGVMQTIRKVSDIINLYMQK